MLTFMPPNVDPVLARNYLEKAKDNSATYDVAHIFGNDNPRPAEKYIYDTSLKDTDVLAYYFDSREIERHNPQVGREMRLKFGADTVIAFNPDVIYIEKSNPGFAKSVIDHEKGHGGQQGKIALKQIYAHSRFGMLPLGEMLIEGGNERALEKSGRKPPSRYMDENSGKLSLYGIYREFAYEIEHKSPGILRQIYRAAHRGGPYAAKRLIEAIPDIENIIDKYASKLANNYRMAA